VFGLEIGFLDEYWMALEIGQVVWMVGMIQASILLSDFDPSLHLREVAGDGGAIGHVYLRKFC
jgi:hypothetical protein